MNQELTILKALLEVHPRMDGVGRLWSVCRMEDETMTYTAFTRALIALETKQQIVVVQGEDRRRAKITDAGIARLAEAGI
jgi:hypothetical protein